MCLCQSSSAGLSAESYQVAYDTPVGKNRRALPSVSLSFLLMCPSQFVCLTPHPFSRVCLVADPTLLGYQAITSYLFETQPFCDITSGVVRWGQVSMA